MNTQIKKSLFISAMAAVFMTSGNALADLTDEARSLNYDNRAYVHAIHDAPNPVSDKIIQFAKITYADKAFGQAIYSYPSNVSFQETDFNVEYVDTAYGQAIYSYPNNNPVRHRLKLSIETQKPIDNLMVPVAFKRLP